MAVPQPIGLDRAQVVDLLASAQSLIRADRLAEAADQYRLLLLEPALDELPAARTEVYANYGALLLHEARLDPAAPQLGHWLDLAIDMLSRAHLGHQLGQSEGSSVTVDTNLGLAYYQRHVATGRHGDLMSAHLALDCAERACIAEEATMLEWVQSIRQLLLAQADRRRQP